MGNKARSAAFALMTLGLLSSAGGAAVQETEIERARARLGEVAKELEDVALLRAKYTQTQHLVTLLKPRVSKGTLYFRKQPGCLLLHVEEPSDVRVRMDET